MKCVPFARARSYSSSVAGIRSVHAWSPHSQTKSARSASNRSALSAMRSLTSRDSAPPVWPPEVEQVASFLRAVGAEARLEELARGEDDFPGVGVRSHEVESAGRRI